MKTKTIVTILLPSLLLLSCAPKKSKEELAHLDLSSPDHFIQSVIDNRKDTYADSSGFEITGRPVFSNGDFHAFNFKENIGKDSYTYSILLNPEISGALDGSDSTRKSVYADLNRLLKKQIGLTYQVLEGNMETSNDFQGDGAPDFVLTQTYSNGKNTKSGQTILLYDGKRRLASADIHALSSYQKGSSESIFIGVKEFFEFKNPAPVTIVVRHWEDSLGLRSIRYATTWKWSIQDTTWKTGFLGTDLDHPGFKKFTRRLTYLENNAGTFTIPENCQSGGPIYFELKRSEPSDLSDYYLIRTGIKDAGYNIVFQIARKDSLTYILYKARGEKLVVPNPFGKTEIQRDTMDATIIIRNDPVHHDLYWLTNSFSPTPLPYTTEPGRYRYVKCQ
ncbi:MAG TPA: hypothetical protein VK517_06630 [Cyclobacteriaceae bacterium]|nr:hypothetical protein [Cyclobacteriaceae bacterium]